MTNNKIEEQFILFLKENLCYHKYFNNINSPSIGFYSFTNLLNHPKELINIAFDWSLTEEGFNYWENISNTWISIYKSYLEKNIYYYETINNNVWND